MKIAITGSNGLLGRDLVRLLLQQGHDLICLTTSFEKVQHGSGYPYLNDLPANYDSGLKGVEVLIHSGSYIPRDHYDSKLAEKCIQENAFKTLRLLESCVKNNVRHFVFISGTNIFKPRDGKNIQLDDPIDCTSSPFYLGSKALSEIYCKSFLRYGLNVSIIRAPTLYGPGQTNGLIFNLINSVVNRLPIDLTCDETYSADFLLRSDLSKFIVDVINNPECSEINVGTGLLTSARQIVDFLCEKQKFDNKNITFTPIFTNGHGFAPVDYSIAKLLYGFQPTDIYQGLTQCVDYYVKSHSNI